MRKLAGRIAQGVRNIAGRLSGGKIGTRQITSSRGAGSSRRSGTEQRFAGMQQKTPAFFRETQMATLDGKSPLAEQMEKELARQECKLEDGTVVSNLEGICQALIGRALSGDLQAAGFIAQITGRK